MDKQQFSDNTYSLAKGLQHTNIAKEYFEDLKRGTTGEVKNMFNSIVVKLDWIKNNIRDRISDESREVFNKELSDCLTFDSINDKLIRLTTEQRSLVETVIDSLISGEEVKIVDESFKY